MEVLIKNRKLKQSLEDPDLCKRKFGALAKTIRMRLEALNAAESLFDFWPPKSKPERVHELLGQQKGTYTIDIKQPFRILFSATDSIVERENDTTKKWKMIKSIEVLSIEDTHG